MVYNLIPCPPKNFHKALSQNLDQYNHSLTVMYFWIISLLMYKKEMCITQLMSVGTNVTSEAEVRCTGMVIGGQEASTVS